MPNARLQLLWPNKDRRLLTHGADTYEWVDPHDWRATEVRLLEHVEDVGVQSDGNLVIHGDALHALTSLTQLPELRARYLGKVKLVYIDPPFNTKQAFAHYNDAVEHSIWLTMMRDRLVQIRQLLSPDGSVWVHLDDVEVHRMRAVLDEVFGAENFRASLVWQKADSPRSDAKDFSVDHDHILVYARSAGWKTNRLPRPPELDAKYKSPDGDQPWFDDNPTAPSAKTHQGMVYAIQSPFTGKLQYPAKGRCWYAEQPRILKALNEWAPYEARDIDDATTRAGICGVPAVEVRPEVKALMLAVPLEQARELATARYAAGNWPEVVFRSGGQGGIGRKSYVPKSGIAPRTLWLNSEVGHNRTAKAEIKALFPTLNPFATPKPEKLLERILYLATDPGDLVLDCFAGSATTAAVALKTGRRFVTVEVLQSNLDQFVVPRLSKVVAGKDAGGVSNRELSVPVADLPEAVSVEAVKAAATTLAALRKHGTLAAVSETALDEVSKALASAGRQRTVVNDNGWQGGSGFRVLRVAQSMFVADDDGDLYLADWVQDKALAQAVCAQMRYSYEPTGPFAGRKGNSRLAVLDAMATEGAVRLLVDALDDGQTLLVVAQAIGDGVEELLRELRKGSKIRKMPNDLARAGVLPSQVVTIAGATNGEDA